MIAPQAARLAIDADLVIRLQDNQVMLRSAATEEELRIFFTTAALPAIRRGAAAISNAFTGDVRQYFGQFCSATGQSVILVMDDQEVVRFEPQRNWLGRLLRLPVGVYPIQWQVCLRLLYR